MSTPVLVPDGRFPDVPVFHPCPLLHNSESPMEGPGFGGRVSGQCSSSVPDHLPERNLGPVPYDYGVSLHLGLGEGPTTLKGGLKASTKVFIRCRYVLYIRHQHENVCPAQAKLFLFQNYLTKSTQTLGWGAEPWKESRCSFWVYKRF